MQNKNLNITPKISVIIPVYNTQEFLRDCLDSVVNQTFYDMEIICINDGSTDKSLEILYSYSQKDKRIIIIDRENCGQGKARNDALRIAKGEYIVFIDSDDWIDLNFCEKLYNTAVKNNVEIAVASMFREEAGKTKKVFKYKKEKFYKTTKNKLQICNIPWDCYCINKIYKKSFLIENSLCFDENKIYEDMIFICKAACISGDFVTVPETVYHYRINTNSSSFDKSEKNEKDLYETKLRVQEYLKNEGFYFDLFEKPKKILVKILGFTLLKYINYRGEKKLYLFGIIPVYKAKISIRTYP